MKVLHLASFDRWTGAAAPAYAEVESLRTNGIDAHYAYVGGYKLEKKLTGKEFCHPVILKRRDPVSIWKSIVALKQLQRRLAVDIVHAHLSHDHYLAVAARGSNKLVRTLHARRTLRYDPISRLMRARTDAFCVVNAEFPSVLTRDRRTFLFTPPPVDIEQFRSDGPNRRALVSTGSEIILGIIGKLGPGRGFEAAIETLAVLRSDRPVYRLMVIGRGSHRENLERLAASLGVAEDVIFVGYHEEGLEEFYRAADVMLFTAPGSDEGHRAVLEELSCGVPVATYPIEGIAAVLGGLAPLSIAPSSTPRALASVVLELLEHGPELRRRCSEQAREFSYAAAGKRLVAFYQSLLEAGA